MTRADWGDIAKAARETSEQLAGKGWVEATFKARTLLADLADEIERLGRERDTLYPAVIYRRQLGCGGPAWWEARMPYPTLHTTIHETEDDARREIGLDPEPGPTG